MQHAVVRLLQAFSLVYEPEIASIGDNAALQRLLALLERQDPLIFLTKDGPAAHALLAWFGLIPPYHGHQRLDVVDPELVCRILVQFEKLKLKLNDLGDARDIIAAMPPNYAPRP